MCNINKNLLVISKIWIYPARSLQGWLVKLNYSAGIINNSLYSTVTYL